MKKLLMVLAALLVVSSAFAQVNPFLTQNATFPTGSPATTDNDDSCDIGVAPAATLLLPYFDVDYANDDSTTAVNTVFTITNTSRMPAIAHVVVWTDWSFPVLDFNIFLTGYDVQGVNLWDVLNRGVIPHTDIDPEHQFAEPEGRVLAGQRQRKPGVPAVRGDHLQ